MLTINPNFDFEINSNSEDLSALINYSSTILTQEATLGLLKNYLHRKNQALFSERSKPRKTATKPAEFGSSNRST